MGYRYGLDLSEHNGTLDFNAIKKAGNEFVILRAGYGWENTDPRFEEYYKKAKEAGLKVGAYFYSYALNTNHAKTEANYMLKLLKGKKFEYPVYIDMEDADGYKKRNGMPSNATLSAICNTFCDIVEKAGYYVGIYASESWFNNQLKGVSSRYDKWNANWGTNDGTLQNERKGYGMHQFTSEYKLNGKRFDRNVVYELDYPTIIKSKGLNGYSKGESKPEQPSKPTTPDKPKPSTKYKVGDVVNINGVYVSSTSSDKLKPAKTSGKITRIEEGVRNPYLLDNGNIGWVNVGCITGKKESTSSSVKVGSKIRIKNGAKDLNTKTTFASFVYSTTYYAQEVKDYVVFGPAKTGAVTGKVKKSDVYLV